MAALQRETSACARVVDYQKIERQAEQIRQLIG